MKTKQSKNTIDKTPQQEVKSKDPNQTNILEQIEEIEKQNKQSKKAK